MPPAPGERRNPVIGIGIVQRYQIAVQLLDRLALLAMPPRLPEESVGQPLLVLVQIAGWFQPLTVCLGSPVLRCKLSHLP